MLEDGRDGSGEGARDDDDGEWLSNDLKPSRMVDLDGQRRKLFFWPDMMVASSSDCSVEECLRLFIPYPGPFMWNSGRDYSPANSETLARMAIIFNSNASFCHH